MLPRTRQQYLAGFFYECYFSGGLVRLTVGRYLSSTTIPLQERERALLQQVG